MDLKKIIGGFLLCLVALGIIGAISSHSSKSTIPAAVQASPTDKWHVTQQKSPMDDSETVVLALDSDDQIQGPLGAVTPSLIVGCQEKETAVYVATGMAASVETDIDGGPSDDHEVRYRLDDGPAIPGSWGESTDHKALFPGDLVFDEDGHVSAFSGGHIQFAKKLASAAKFTFEFTPFDGSPQVARFDLRGLDVHLHKVAEACGWAYE